MKTFIRFGFKCQDKKRRAFIKEFPNFVETPQKDDRIPVRKGLSLTVIARTFTPGTEDITVICSSKNARKTDEAGHIAELVAEGWELQQ